MFTLLSPERVNLKLMTFFPDAFDDLERSLGRKDPDCPSFQAVRAVADSIPSQGGLGIGGESEDVGLTMTANVVGFGRHCDLRFMSSSPNERKDFAFICPYPCSV